jgi:transposase
MKLYFDKRARDPIYYVQQGYRRGAKTTTKNVARIGKHSELLKLTDDPLSYAREQIVRLNEEQKSGRVTMEMVIDFQQKLKPSETIASLSNQRNIGYFILQNLYQRLDIAGFFRNATEGSKITYDPDRVNRFMTYARILEPDSKLGTYDHLSRYYEEPDFEYVHMLRTMDIMEEHYDEYLTHLFRNSCNIVPRDTAVCYFDCTNYYFETETHDDDYIDEVTGEIIKGLRKYGPSKEHRPNPIVEMGLFIDAKGIPLTMCINSGSDNEQTCVIPLERQLTKMLDGKKFIYCADAGLGSINIRKFNSMGGRAFIVTQSIKKLSKVLKEAVFNDYDYRLLSSDEAVSIGQLKTFDRTDEENLSLYKDKAYKVITADRAVDLGLYDEVTLKNGRTKKVQSKALLTQRIIVTFSRKMMEYQRAVRHRQIERATNLLKHIDPDSYKKGPHDVTRFIKRTSRSKSGETVSDYYAIDQSVIEEDEKYDGYYALATNLDDEAKPIIEISSKRYEIEDCFRVMKTNFSTRPVYHKSRERIIAHFMVCYTALLIFRLLEAKLEAIGTRFTTENIIETLRNMEVVNVQDMYYLSTFTNSLVCAALNDVFEMGLDKKHYLPKELNRKIKQFLK